MREAAAIVGCRYPAQRPKRARQNGGFFSQRRMRRH